MREEKRIDVIFLFSAFRKVYVMTGGTLMVIKPT
ncbi:hypothetical protein IC006_2485 [Sulfuracidifex tepidarius]|uniref:Uncharacterized protein n=1 Tax=Sulfuracidifex tepidarius TaxID=1294262 RepID=A0A510E745_9CREN|nr:hypothetical protein IC006_2485 [Sulfuracidifex tepidarius]BBG27938.1 hypothetical protein IC007_2493 [Sulfuracidifex tepidarius]